MIMHTFILLALASITLSITSIILVEFDRMQEAKTAFELNVAVLVALTLVGITILIGLLC